MAEIQMITYSGNDEKYLGKSMTVNNFHDVQSLDSFDINIIDLNNEQIWKNERDSNESVNIINEFKSLSIMINQRKKSKIIVILPQNCVFKYYKKSNSNSYYRQCELKDMLKSLLVNILSKLCNLLGRIDLIYENTVTEIDGHNIKSSFSFINSYRNFLTRSKKVNLLHQSN